MTTEPKTAKSTAKPKAGSTAAVKKPAAKTKSKLATIAKPDAASDGPSKTQIAVLTLLAEKGAMSRSEVRKAKGGVFIGGKIMGHVDPKKLKPTSLVGRGLATLETAKEGERGPARYKITEAGRKALAAR